MSQRAYWVHGVDSFAAYARLTLEYSVVDRLDRITCPVLLTVADNGPPGAQSPLVAEALGDRATLLRFTAAEGAGRPLRDEQPGALRTARVRLAR